MTTEQSQGYSTLEKPQAHTLHIKWEELGVSRCPVPSLFFTGASLQVNLTMGCGISRSHQSIGMMAKTAKIRPKLEKLNYHLTIYYDLI